MKPRAKRARVRFANTGETVMRRSLSSLALAGALAVSACVTAPPPPTPGPAPTPAPTPTPGPAPAAPTMTLVPGRFDEVPGWPGADLKPALEAFRRQCRLWTPLPDDTPINRNGAAYGGTVRDWRPACAAAAAAGDARAFFEGAFVPHRVQAQGGQARLTAYFFPVIPASHAEAPGFTEPLLPRPSDMVTVDLAAFAARLDNGALAGAPATLTGQVSGTHVVPYPERATIMQSPGAAIAWAHPADVYKLQVQGSGRLGFSDGSPDLCASFAAQNGARWRSALGQLKASGVLPANPHGLWAAMRDYFDAHPDKVRAALDADPSYVFFQAASPSTCPKGASGAVLVGGGSLAVDPRFHPYGAPIFVHGPDAPGFPRLLIAQDTGGAIRQGPLRGDVFMGEGEAAGAAAEAVNFPDPQWWVLLPKPGS
jgi:membrane-bound lytic murein transglycosylase A